TMDFQHSLILYHAYAGEQCSMHGLPRLHREHAQSRLGRSERGGAQGCIAGHQGLELDSEREKPENTAAFNPSRPNAEPS
ncbi:MAG TPA: hypothetical protein VF178_03600, partial [Gemmatimonadaceae bacterium]